MPKASASHGRMVIVLSEGRKWCCGDSQGNEELHFHCNLRGEGTHPPGIHRPLSRFPALMQVDASHWNVPPIGYAGGTVGQCRRAESARTWSQILVFQSLGIA